MIKKMLENTYTPILIFAVGVILQFILFKIGFANSIVAPVWFLLPVAGIAGMVIAMVQRKKEKSTLSLIGFGINLLWFLAFAYFFYVIVAVNW